MILNKRGEIYTGYKEKNFYVEGGEALAQVSQRGSRCPIPGHIPGQVGWGSEKPDLLKMFLLTAGGLD